MSQQNNEAVISDTAKFKAVRYRPLRSEDCSSVAELIDSSRDRGFLLPRVAEDIADNGENFVIAELANRVVGCVALRPFGQGLEELRSLAVAGDCCGHGIGGQLIVEALRLAEARQATEVFALTLMPKLFLRHGFNEADKERFPQKVWLDCRKCAFRDCCKEVAVHIELPKDRQVTP